MADIQIHDVDSIEISEATHLRTADCDSQRLYVTSESGIDQITFFGRKGESIEPIPTATDLANEMVNTITKEIRNLDHLDQLPGPDGAIADVMAAIDCYAQTDKARSIRHLEALRSARHEWEKWEDANQGELALVNALISSYMLKADEWRFLGHYSAAIAGFAVWADRN